MFFCLTIMIIWSVKLKIQFKVVLPEGFCSMTLILLRSASNSNTWSSLYLRERRETNVNAKWSRGTNKHKLTVGYYISTILHE